MRESDYADQMIQKRAIIVGSGVVGVANAWALSRRGWQVTIIDAASGPALGSSFANGAQLSYVYVDALASPSMVKRLPWLALGLDPTFRMRPSFDPEVYRWALSFIREGTEPRWHANTLAQLELALESRTALHALLAKHPLDFGHVRAGKLHLYGTEQSYAGGRKMMALKAPLGAVQRVISPREAAEIEPALADRSDALAGVIFSPEEEVGDPHLFAAGLLDILVRDYGAEVRFDFPVKAITSGKGEAIVDGPERLSADAVFVCTGTATQRLLRPLGFRAPIQPSKGYSITAPAGSAAPRVSITDTERRLVFANLSGKIRIAGLAELGSSSIAVRPKRLGVLIDSAREALPHAADYDAIESSWAGLRPMTPSSRPIIAQAAPGIFVNAGHGILGWTLAMGSAERAAGLLG